MKLVKTSLPSLWVGTLGWHFEMQMTVALGIAKFCRNSLSLLQLTVCIGVTEHTEFKCHVKCPQNNYTLLQQLKVIELNIRKVTDERREV